MRRVGANWGEKQEDEGRVAEGPLLSCPGQQLLLLELVEGWCLCVGRVRLAEAVLEAGGFHTVKCPEQFPSGFSTIF